MVSTFTPNIQLEEPARGDDVGTWDTPVNNNMTLIDLVCGAINTISLNNSNVILTAAQYKSKQITFNSTLTASVIITFPTSFTKSYEIQNLCTGTSAFTITLQTTASGGQVIALPPGETIDCFNDGTNLKFKNLDRIGSYWDYAGSSVPAWVSGCTVPPYLYCNGATFSSSIYPQLAIILGSTTLPDHRGRANFYLNDGTGRLTSAGAGIDGNTRFATGGNNGVTLSASNIPSIASGGANTITVYPSGNSGFYLPYYNSASWSVYAAGNGIGAVAQIPGAGGFGQTNSFSASNNITVVYNNASLTSVQNAPPGTVGGIRMIRAA